jgi:hypothetical protein
LVQSGLRLFGRFAGLERARQDLLPAVGRALANGVTKRFKLGRDLRRACQGAKRRDDDLERRGRPGGRRR